MSKPLAAFYGYRKINHPQQPKPQEYTVLGVNQPLIAPDQANIDHQTLTQAERVHGKQHSFLLSLVLNRWG